MQLTGELAPLGYAHRSTEFIVAGVGPDIGKLIYGACGPTALASAASATRQTLVTTESVYALMQPRGLCDAAGITTDGKIATAAAALGLTIAEHHPYGGDVWNGWQTFLGWHLGSCDHPCVIELAHGQNLVDAISGQGENASGLTYHFIALIKRHAGGYSAYAGKTLPSGYWACDGDNYAGGNNRTNAFAAADVLQFYSDTVLTAAMPCAGIAFNRAPVTVTGGGGSVGTAGTATPFYGLDYTSDAQVWHCPATGFDVGHGFLTFYEGVKGPGGQTATQILGLPKSQEYPVGSVTKQDFERGRLVYDGSKADPWQVTLDSTFDSNAAALKAAQYAASTAQAAEVNVQAQLTAANAQIAQLQAQLAALQNAPAPTPQPAPLTQQQQNDLAAMESIRKALAA